MNDKKDSYNPDWKMEYIELKGWENMSEGEKYLCTHTISSSVEGMGNMKLMAELKEMKAKAKSTIRTDCAIATESPEVLWWREFHEKNRKLRDKNL
jgi:hypothetical protein